ncbi:MAG: Gfo/Idh/MocA family protein [Christensenellales bacterium]
MKAPLRYGILGYAGIAYKHVLPALLQADNAVPYALASRSKEKLMEGRARFGFQKLYGDYEALLDDPDVDVVYIPLPNALHKGWTIKAARKGKHVLCEKPLALTEEDCRQMFDACQENGVKLMEAFMYRYTPRLRILQELLASGLIGEIRHIHSNWRFLLTDNSNVRLSEGLGGGSLRDVGCYPVNLIGLLMGEEPVSVCARKVTFQGVDRALSAVLTYPGGVLCTLSSGFDAHSPVLTEINGTLGTLLLPETYDQTDAPIQLYKDGKVSLIPVPACSRYRLEIEAFSRDILEDRQPLISREETLRNNRLIGRILAAAEGN